MVKALSLKSEADGRMLALWHWPFDAQPDSEVAYKGQVQILHGVAEHALRYDHVAKFLNAAGFEVFAHDHRGFGKSISANKETTDDVGGEFQVYGHFADEDGWQKALQDCEAVRKHFTQEGSKCFLLAHSMGSFMGQCLIQQATIPYAGVALSGTKGPLGLKDRLAGPISAFELWRRGARKPSPLTDKLMEMEFNRHFKPTNTPYDWICSDPAVVAAYMDDPLCGGEFTSRLSRDMYEGLKRIFDTKASGNYSQTPKDLPIYLFAGALDPVSEMAKGVSALRDFLINADFNNVRMDLYDGMRHETLNEPGVDLVLANLKAWLLTL